MAKSLKHVCAVVKYGALQWLSRLACRGWHLWLRCGLRHEAYRVGSWGTLYGRPYGYYPLKDARRRALARLE